MSESKNSTHLDLDKVRAAIARELLSMLSDAPPSSVIVVLNPMYTVRQRLEMLTRTCTAPVGSDPWKEQYIRYRSKTVVASIVLGHQDPARFFLYWILPPIAELFVQQRGCVVRGVSYPDLVQSLCIAERLNCSELMKQRHKALASLLFLIRSSGVKDLNMIYEAAATLPAPQSSRDWYWPTSDPMGTAPFSEQVAFLGQCVDFCIAHAPLSHLYFASRASGDAC